MHHGCYHQCPKVREQLRKAREQAGEEPEEEDSSSDSLLSAVSGPSNLQQPSKNASKRSKDSSRHSPGFASPAKSARSPRRSHENAHKRDEEYSSVRGSPEASRRFDPEVRSHRRSKESQRRKEYPSSRGTPISSPGASRRFDPEVRSHRRSKESQRRKEYNSGRGTPIGSPDSSRRFDPDEGSFRRSKESQRRKGYPLNRESPSSRSPDASRKFDREEISHRRSEESGRRSPRSIRHARREPPDEYRSGSSSRTDSGDRTPHYVPTIKRTVTKKPRDEKGQRRGREFDDEAIAGPSGISRGLRDFADDELEDDEYDSNAHDLCDSRCRGIDERMRNFTDEEQRKTFDEYLVYKGLPYFGDFCVCSYECLAKQLWNNRFAMSTVASAALFAVGLTLCSELDGWTIPNTFT